jgi:hypothetical protein
MVDPIRDALERAARELELVAGSLTQAGWAAAGSRARNEAHAARAALDAQPPAPTTDTPLDLDALLSPEGAYEPGTGHEDGAQLVDQLEWWAPLHGCDTLDNLLDRIRSRILPHLRPPIAGIDVPGGDGDYGDVLDLCEAEGVDPRIGAPLLRRARQAWKVSAQPLAPAPASDGEREELAAWLDGEAQSCAIQFKDRILRAATLLRNPAPAAVPADLTPTRYLHSSGATIERTRWEPDAWAVRISSERMSILGQWSIEPSPSERTAEYLAQHSFSSPHAALAVLQQQKPPQGGEVEQ